MFYVTLPPQEPDFITVGGASNKKEGEIVGSTDDAGTFTWNNDTKTLSYLITGQQSAYPKLSRFTWSL